MAFDRVMTIEELKKENKALKEENAQLTYSIAELLKKIEELRAALEIKEQKDLKKRYLKEASTIVKKLMEKVNDMPISVRTKNVLFSAGCYTLGDIVKLEKYDLIKLRNCGRKSIMEITDLVNNSGFTWQMDVDGIIEADMKEYLKKKDAANK